MVDLSFLSNLLSAYQANQQGLSGTFYDALRNAQNYGSTANQQFGSNAQLISDRLLSQLPMQDATVPVNVGYQGVGDEWKMLYEKEANSAIGEWGKAYDLLKDEDVTDANNRYATHQGYLSDYVNSSRNLADVTNRGWGEYGSQRDIAASQVPGFLQGYATHLNDVTRNRSNILQSIAGVRQNASEMLARGTQLRAERQQRNLTDRTNYYANQASRNANTQVQRAERLQGSAIQRQRNRLGSFASPSSGYLSSMLNR